MPEWLHFSGGGGGGGGMSAKSTWEVVMASAAAVFPVPDEHTTICEAYQQADCPGKWPTTMLSIKCLLLSDHSRCSPRV